MAFGPVPGVLSNAMPSSGLRLIDPVSSSQHIHPQGDMLLAEDVVHASAVLSKVFLKKEGWGNLPWPCWLGRLI